MGLAAGFGLALQLPHLGLPLMMGGGGAARKGPGPGPRLCTTQALTYIHLLVHVRLCAGTRGVGGLTAALHRKSLLVSVSKGRFCGGSAVSHLGISPVQLLPPSLETLSFRARSL